MDARMVRAAEERQRFPPPVRLPASPVPATPRTEIPARRPGRQLQSSWLPSSSTSCCLLEPGYLQHLPSSSKVRCSAQIPSSPALDAGHAAHRGRCEPYAPLVGKKGSLSRKPESVSMISTILGPEFLVNEFLIHTEFQWMASTSCH